MGLVLIACYKPIEGKEEELCSLIKTHAELIKSEGLATNRESILMKSKDNSVIEVFEWKSKEAFESAKTNPNVQKLWYMFSQISDFIPLSNLDETSEVFADFIAIK